MGWRIIEISSRAKLELRAGYMVVRKSDITRIHLEEINTLIISSTQVSVTTSLLNELVKHKAKVIFCDEKRNPSCELTGYYGSHDSSAKIKNQMQWTSCIKGEVWTEIVAEKIRQQARVLRCKDLNESGLLEMYVDEIQYFDVTNREGHAAKVYFNALFGKDFTRSADNYINAALNYGYSIILSEFNRVVTANGYLTQLGLFHDNQFNQYNLSSDLMEPFRPLIDIHVSDTEYDGFGHEEKLALIDIMNKEILIDNKVQHVSNAIKIYCRSVFDALDKRDASLIKFFKDEL